MPNIAEAAFIWDIQYAFRLLNVSSLHLLSTPIRLCPFILMTTGLLWTMLTTLKIDIREKHLSPSHRDWISDFPYTAPLASVERQDVSPPLVVWITHFPFVMYVQTHYPGMY